MGLQGVASNSYGLTLDEIRNQLVESGKSLSNMDVDELLVSAWIDGDDNQAMEVLDHHPTFDQPVVDGSLIAQSSLGLTGDLNRTVDELWQEIKKGESSLDRKPLGEMTLEDFLVKAGVVVESSAWKKNLGSMHGAGNPPQQDQWTKYQNPMMPTVMPSHPIQQPTPTGGDQVIDAIYSEMEIVTSPSTLMGTESETQKPRRRRIPPCLIEKSAERRMKRMIKNRESAARSRARKHAYQLELEGKVSDLEEENQRLKKMKELELLFPRQPLTEPRYQLRRTSSAPL